MTIDDKHPDNLFRSKLEGFEQSPPGWLWDSIQEQLAEKRRWKIIVWLRVGAVAAALVLAFLIGHDYQQDEFLVRPTFEVMAEEDSASSKTNDQQGLQTKAEYLPSTQLAATKATDEDAVAGVIDQPTYSHNSRDEREQNHRLTATNLLGEPQVYEQAVTYLASLKVELDSWITPTSELMAMERLTSESGLSESDRQIMAYNAQQIQEDKSERVKKNWALGAAVAPSVSINKANYSESYSRSMNQTSGKSNLSLGGGLTLAMQTQSRWSVQSGVMYSRLGQNSSNSPQSEQFYDYSDVAGFGTERYFVSGQTDGNHVVINGPAGEIVMSKLPQDVVVQSDFEVIGTSKDVYMSSSGFEQVFDYVEIPLLVRYNLIDRKVNLELMAGINTGFLVGNSAYQTEGNSRARIGSTSDMRSVVYSPSFGLGVGYELSSKVQLRVEPQWRYSVESLSRNSNVNYRPSTFGFYTGLSYSF